MTDNDASFKGFGKPFQERVIQALLSDHDWARQMMEVIKVEYFDVAHLRVLFDVYSKHYALYKTFPSLQILMMMVKDQLREGNDVATAVQIVSFVQGMMHNPDASDLPYIKDRALNFCRNQALKEALEVAVDLTKEEKYEQIVERIKTAITVGTPNTTGHDFFDDIDSRFQKEQRHVIATGLGPLDDREVMNGGLAGGELGLILASTGVGKSHFLVQLGANALRQKKNVLHYTFELSEAKVGNRYDSNLCGVSATDILDEGEYVKKSLAELRPNLGRLIIKEYPTNSATVMTLRAHIEKLAITKSFRPDIILVDYADIMRSSRQFDAIRHEQKLIYEELRGLCMELHIPIWTASQSNRDSTDADVVGLDKIAESFGKAQVCDFIISLARKPVQKSKGQANLFVAKSRLGRDGLLFATHIDTSMSMFEIIGDELDLEELQNARRDSMNKLVLEKWNEVANERMAFEKKAMHAVKE